MTPKKEVLQDQVQLANGDFINGKVKVATFEVKIGTSGTLKLARDDISSIEFAHPPRTTRDTVQIGPVTRLQGDVQPATIPVEVENGGVLDFPKTDIHTIVFDKWRALSEGTRKMLEGRKKP